MIQTVGCLFAFLFVGLAILGQETSLMPTAAPEPAGWKKIGVSGDVPATLDWQATAGRTGGGCFHILARDMGSKTIGWRTKIKPPEGVQALQFSVWIKGKGAVGGAWMVVVGLRSDPSQTALNATTSDAKPLKDDFDWTLVQATLTLPSDVHEVMISFYLYWAGEAWFDGLTMRPADRPANFQEFGPGLIEVKGSFQVEALKQSTSPKILFPLPMSYGVQVPLTFRLWTEPASGLVRSRVYEDTPGNWVCEARIAKVKPGKPIGVRWSSIVLCAPDPVRKLPQTIPFPTYWPKEAKPWLKSTYSVESADPRFVAIAKNILSKGNDLLAVIHEADHESNTIQVKGSGKAPDQRSTTALTKAVDCTGNANRLAAILRACNIPARVMACYLIGDPLQTHYQVEVYIPAEGWLLLDALLHGSHGFDQVLVSAATPKTEDRSQGRCPNNSGGVPYLSLNESPGCNGDFLFLGDLGGNYSDHSATQWRLFPSDAPSTDWESALKESRLAWQKWLESAKRWHKGTGSATPLTREQLEKADLSNLPKIVRQSEGP